MNAGTPEPADWKRLGMVQYLNDCAANPDRLAVALHEYTFNIDWTMSEVYPFLMGRFEALHAACDQLLVARPTVIITESGWEYNDMPGETAAMIDVEWYSFLLSEYPNVLGAMLWTLEGPSALPDKLQKLIEPITTYALNTTFSDTDPPPPPPPNGRITPAKVKHTVHLLPQNTTLDELQTVTIELHPTRSAFTYSADAAHAVVYPGTDESRVIVWSGERWDDDIYAWLDDRGVRWESRSFSIVPPPPPPPPPGDGNALIGLHAPADGGDGLESDFAEFRNLLGGMPGVIKVLSSHSESHVQRLATENPGCQWIIRAFLSMCENGQPRDISPAQFFNDTISDVKRALNILHGLPVVVELGNEPNLRSEGLDGSWFDGFSFISWFKAVLAQYRLELPEVEFLYPGLSPGFSYDDGVERRILHTQFIEESREAVLVSDGLAIHTYWSPPFPMPQALAVVDDLLARFPNHRAWITEASNNERDMSIRPSPDVVAQQYVNFWREIKRRPRVEGVTYFVCSASDPFFEAESWVGKGLGARVRGLIPR